nr:MAG TPA: hypothetical protein [Caudoviricetes sp.]
MHLRTGLTTLGKMGLPKFRSNFDHHEIVSI